MNYQEIKKTVLEILINEPLSRSNDKYLIYRVLVTMGLPTDLQDLINTRISFESITRSRRKWQQQLPELNGNETSQILREKLRDQIKADAIGVEYGRKKNV